MYGAVNLKLIGVLAAAVVLFVAGWIGNGWRWESKYVSMQKAYADAIIESNRQARRQEQIMQSKADTELVNKNAEIKNIRAELDLALDELRKRPSRVPVPNAPGAAKGATGAELSREDAGFLTREAARADALRAELNYCYRMYDEAKESSVSKKQQ
jgi:hypothetical protein